ncbi:MAG: histidine--tRNA ligase [Candidatus Magasanikbacteria bacterium]|nr:histidine--tRNA ligase [Candidatus Magasanikbacteria bacterium]
MSKDKKMKMKKPEVKKVVKTAKPAKEKDVSAEKGKRTYGLLRGMHDILPKDEKYWKPMYKSVSDLAEHFQFSRIETPILEEVGVFIRGIGKGTDVVDKEMYVFEDKDTTKVAMRPEMTASVVRAYIMHGFWNMPQPTKLWYWGPMFRHDRPQAGRYRQFHQFGFETFGSADPAMDAELILVAFDFFKDLGLPVEIKINSIGTLAERANYKNELVNYYRSKRSYLCEECRQRITKNPMRLLDCKEPGCQTVKEEAPQIINWLGAESKNHFMKVLEYLDVLEIPYQLDHTLVRGLNYYTNTVFEIYPADEIEGSQSALGGGGRYDLLVEEMGGRPTPAAGMAIGLERAVLALKQYNEKNSRELPKVPTDAYVAQLGEEARRVTLKLINQLRGAGVKIAFNFFKTSLKSQICAASKNVGSSQVRFYR